MTGPAKFSPIPRAKGPEYLARCTPLHGYWWLSVLDRRWESVDGKFTDVLAAGGPLPSDAGTQAHLAKVLAGFGFGVPPGQAWAQDPDRDDAWVVEVVPVTTPPRT